MSQIDQTTFTTAATDTSKALTRVMILHPIACGVAFIAFLLALGSGVCGAIFAAMVAAVASGGEFGPGVYRYGVCRQPRSLG